AAARAEAGSPEKWCTAVAAHCAGASRPGPGRTEHRVQLVNPGFEPDQVGAALEQEILAELVAPVHLEREPTEVAQLLLTQPHQRPALAAEIARGRSGTSPSRCRRRRRIGIAGMPAQELLQARETHGASVLGASERLFRGSEVDHDEPVFGQLAYRVGRS